MLTNTISDNCWVKPVTTAAENVMVPHLRILSRGKQDKANINQNKIQLRSLFVFKEPKTAAQFTRWTATEILYSRWFFIYVPDSEVASYYCYYEQLMGNKKFQFKSANETKKFELVVVCSKWILAKWSEMVNCPVVPSIIDVIHRKGK